MPTNLAVFSSLSTATRIHMEHAGQIQRFSFSSQEVEFLKNFDEGIIDKYRNSTDLVYEEAVAWKQEKLLL